MRLHVLADTVMLVYWYSHSYIFLQHKHILLYAPVYMLQNITNKEEATDENSYQILSATTEHHSTLQLHAQLMNNTCSNLCYIDDQLKSLAHHMTSATGWF